MNVVDHTKGEERLVWDPHQAVFVPVAAHAQAHRFLKGPIPWRWIEVAAAQPGRALEVGLCIWRLAGAMKSDTIKLGNREVARLGVDRYAKSRALAHLKRAGLIEVESRPGRLPMVTIIN
jgi:hypothetical protein